METSLNKKIKICFFIPAWNGGGVEKVTINLIKSILAKVPNYSIDLVIATKPNKKYVIHDIEVYTNFRMVYLSKKKPIFSFISFLKLCKASNYDIIISSTYPLNIISCIIRKYILNIPLIITEHIYLSEALKNSNYYLSKIFYKKLIAYYYKYADKIVAVSKGIKENIQSYVKSVDIDIIYNPVYSNAQLSNAKIIRNNIIDAESFVFIAVGSLIYQKGFDILIKAFKLLVDENIKIGRMNIKLIILGSGTKYNELTTLISNLKLSEKAFLLGFKDDALNWINSSDCFILTSRWEGLPTVLVEAMALGKPVIATNCPSGPSELILNEYNGILLRSYKPEEIAKNMNRIVIDEELRKNIGLNAKVSVSKFNIEYASDKYNEIINKQII